MMKEGGPQKFWMGAAAHAAALLPLALAGIAAVSGGLGYNPIQAMEQRLGWAALALLTASLTVSPLHTLTGWRAVLPLRRLLGVYAFVYAGLHFLVFLVLDHGFDLAAALAALVQKPFLLLGFTAGLILAVLALLSIRTLQRRMGRLWQGLRRLTYTAAILAVLHYALALKGNLLTLSGDVLKPALWGLGILILLALRLPPVRRALRKWSAARREPGKKEEPSGNEP